MGIEKEIRQVQFDNEWHKLRCNLVFSYGWLMGAIKDFLSPFGITQKQFNILRILRGHREDPPLSILDIRERMLDKMSDVSRIVDRLHKKSLVGKKTCDMDKRTTRVWITKEGEKLLKMVDRQVDQMDRITEGLTKEEARQLNDLLDKMRDNN